jgi:NAD(P)-dependent dehydrogenase (short-subunit alcohol dehydrogenase family)
MTADLPILITGGTGQQGRAAARAFAERLPVNPSYCINRRI